MESCPIVISPCGRKSSNNPETDPCKYSWSLSTQVWITWVHLYMDFFHQIHWKFFLTFGLCEKGFFFSLAFFILRTQHTVQVTYQICFKQLFMLLVRLLWSAVSYRQSSFGGVKSYTQIFSSVGGWCPNPLSFKGQLYSQLICDKGAKAI